jgi:hypothetical protein
MNSSVLIDDLAEMNFLWLGGILDNHSDGGVGSRSFDVDRGFRGSGADSQNQEQDR